MPSSIISYNVNGIRAAIKKGFFDWMATNPADVICLQETKANKDQVDIQPLTDLGYHDYWFSAEKKGYSGVAIFTKEKPNKVICGTNSKFDFEGRIIQADYDSFTLVNIYFPSGTSGDIRQDVKYDFLEYIFDYLQVLKKEKKVIVVGDYNIANTELDIHNPKSKSSGFLPDERTWLTKFFNSGFVDSFRKMNPETQKYSWWSYRANSRANNKGWRIDYIAVSENLEQNIKSADILNDIVHSDHCPVKLELNL